MGPVGDTTQLLAAGEAAPFGKGMATVLDPAVRRATQLDAAKVHFGPGWERTLSDITQECALDLGLDEHQTAHVHANLYKLLLYEPGGHFAAHRDTEKEPGMFATLVVQLPVAGGHAGGVLTVRHGGRHVTWATERDSRTRGDLQYAAFFADCEHELSAVTAGLRVVLVYNLVLQGQEGQQGPPVRAGAGLGVVERLRAAVRGWERAAEGNDDGDSDWDDDGTYDARLVTLALEHKYTEANLLFRGLKGHDARLVGLLQQCGGLELHLALVTKKISGRSDAPDAPDDSDWDDDGGCAEMMEVEYCELSSSDLWVSESGRKVDYGRLHANLNDALLPGEPRFDDDTREETEYPDERIFGGYTGNEGATLEYVYHRAVVVMWPRSRSESMALGAGLGPALDLLDRRLVEVARGGGAAAAVDEQVGQQGGAGGGQDAVLEAIEVLRGVTDLVVQGPNKPPSYSYGSWSRGNVDKNAPSYDSMAARALKLVASPAGCKVAAATGGSGEAVGVRIVGGLERNGVGLGSGTKTKIADALAAASNSLSSPAFDDAVVRLVRAAGARHVAQAAALGRSSAAGLNLRLRVVDALCNAAMADGSTFAALKQEDVLTLARLVYGMYDSAAGSTPAVGFAGAGGGAAALAAGADPVDVTQTAPDLQAVVRHPERFASRFAELVAARPYAEGLHKTLLAEGVVRAAVQAGHPAARALVAPRLRALQAIRAAGRPAFGGWEQPAAQLPGYPQVQAFLRGPQMQATFSGMFSGKNDARDWVSTYFGGYRYVHSAGGYSATAAAGGSGRKAYVTVTKTYDVYDKAVQQYEKDMGELADLEALLGAAGAGAGVGAGGGAVGAV